jgi:hypothetical protein
LTSNFVIRSIVIVAVGTDYEEDKDMYDTIDNESLKNRETPIDIYAEMQKISWFSDSNRNTMNYLYDIKQFFEMPSLLDNNETPNVVSKPIPIPAQTNYG